MTKDLEETLSGLGPEYAVMVKSMKGAFEGPVKVPFRKRPLLMSAAAIAVLLGGVSLLASHFAAQQRVAAEGGRRLTAFMLADEKTREAVEEIIRTQNPDGSWQTDFLTRRNADALLSSTHPAARTAYRKAVRNLRVRGLL